MKSAVAIVIAMLVLVMYFSPASEAEPSAPSDPYAAARMACKQLLTTNGYVAAEWGSWWDWTAVTNSDGTVSVGAKFMGTAPGGVTRNLYVSCVMTQAGDNFRLESLSRLM